MYRPVKLRLQKLWSELIVLFLGGDFGLRSKLSLFISKARERIDARQSADLSWIEAARLGDDELLANMLNCGQLINNRTTEMNSNVAYAEIDVPLTELDRSLMKYIPNVVYSAHDEAHVRLCGNVVFQ